MLKSTVTSLWFKTSDGTLFQTDPEHFKNVSLGFDLTTIVFLMSTFKKFVKYVPLLDKSGNVVFDEETGEEILQKIPYACESRGTLKVDLNIDRKTGRVNSKVLQLPDGIDFLGYDLESHFNTLR